METYSIGLGVSFCVLSCYFVIKLEFFKNVSMDFKRSEDYRYNKSALNRHRKWLTLQKKYPHYYDFSQKRTNKRNSGRNCLKLSDCFNFQKCETHFLVYTAKSKNLT